MFEKGQQVRFKDDLLYGDAKHLCGLTGVITKVVHPCDPVEYDYEVKLDLSGSQVYARKGEIEEL